jgi:branched-subunit amino acid ABC-type transport system permease component
LHTLGLAIGFGFVTSAIVAISAVAASLQFSVTPIPNFMHGEFLTAGAYGALVAQRLTHSLVAAFCAGVVVGGGLAWCMDRGVLSPFIKRGSPRILLLVSTVAVGIVLQALTALIFGVGPQVLTLPISATAPHSVGPFLFTDIDFAVMATAVAAMLGLHLLLQHTKFGKAQRAVCDNGELAAASGISTSFVIQMTWLMVGGLAGLAGVLLASIQGSFDPYFGFNFLLVTLAAAVVGGIGRAYGAMAGALIIGMVTEVSGAYLNASFKQAGALLVLVSVLLVRPSGLVPALREAE